MNNNNYYVFKITSNLLRTAKKSLELSIYFKNVYEIHLSSNMDFLIFSQNSFLSNIDKLNIITKYLLNNSIDIELKFPQLIPYVKSCNDYKLMPLQATIHTKVNKINSKICYSIDLNLINSQNLKHEFIAHTIINLSYTFNDVVFHTDKYGNKVLLLKK